MATADLSSIDAKYVESLASGDPSWLISLRKDAFTKYQSLPPEVSTLYAKYSDVNKIKPESIHFALGEQPKASINNDLADRLKDLEKETGILQIGQEPARIIV
ncbi:MAG TPA: Fe-S cluster assembly protein SufD, partial [Nitrososphaera sp.]|nr:Fe-S cluster assembly protein SufD [Nitrososphaera sp.]